MVIIDDASPDRTSELLARHLRWRGVSREQVYLVKSSRSNKAMANIFYGLHKYCRLGEIQYTIDGDDELLGRQVFKVMNAVYQKEQMMTVYSSHVLASRSMDNPFHYLGYSRHYLQADIDSNNFRKTRQRGYHHLRTMMTDTFLLMHPSSFQD